MDKGGIDDHRSVAHSLSNLEKEVSTISTGIETQDHFLHLLLFLPNDKLLEREEGPQSQISTSNLY